MATPSAGNALTPQVQQWLHRVIQPEYFDTHNTYRNVAATLYQFPTLSPRTEVYTHEDGRPQLLIHLSGTLPVVFRGATYNIPLTIWLPHEYPKKPPMVFVTPAKDMLIRPGNHVDPSGRCYHPYLANWVNYSDVCLTALYV
ncbi:Suppressor protein stp22 of temperature-sensitive alpha-factor receptor and arginine permease [Maublancomyces gigas]|uniref:Suppressor protein stp22 of temperature-sensitive alpha-factor receptor and arginine permease n=1 Tax=Discina gigas TaxID=1032678 RepID=A0ABR3GT65_9PEZI